MTQAEAQSLMAKLLGAFPGARREQATVAVYVEQLVKCKYEPALAAINEAVLGHKDSRSLPTIGRIIELYRATKEPSAPPELEEAPLTDEERIENLRRINLLSEHFATPQSRRVPMSVLIDRLKLPSTLSGR